MIWPTVPRLSVAEIMEIVGIHGLDISNVDGLVPQMLRAVCTDEHVDAVELFIKKFEVLELYSLVFFSQRDEIPKKRE